VAELETAAAIPAPPLRTLEPPAEKIVSETFVRSPFEADQEESDQPLDLLYHPSYQEQSAAANRRRRRRPDLPAKEELSVEPVAATLEPETAESSRKERFPRPLRREREELPIEQVTVEMTPLEQDVYALMGVSPLVRLDRSIRDPKSAIVSVRLPGEVEAAPVVVPITIEPDPESFSFPEVEAVTESLETAAVVAESAPEIAQEPELEALNGTIETAGLLRRRRRRSSAQSE
jgi:ribonuclease E